MKKYWPFIFLPFLFLLALVNAGFIPSAKSNIAVSQVSRSTGLSNHDVKYPVAEIEYADGSNTGQFHPGLQRVPACFSNHGLGILFCTSSPLAVQFCPIELFDNHNLSHNYPSHNFW